MGGDKLVPVQTGRILPSPSISSDFSFALRRLPMTATGGLMFLAAILSWSAISHVAIRGDVHSRAEKSSRSCPVSTDAWTRTTRPRPRLDRTRRLLKKLREQRHAIRRWPGLPGTVIDAGVGGRNPSDAIATCVSEAPTAPRSGHPPPLDR